MVNGMHAFFLVLLIRSSPAGASDQQGCAVKKQEGGAGDFWNNSNVQKIDIEWLQITEKYAKHLNGNNDLADGHLSPLIKGEKGAYFRKVEPFNFSMFVHSTTDVVSDSIKRINTPYCDPTLVALGIEILESKGRGNFLDIGSNIGSCALVWGSMGHTVWAVEPMSHNIKLIRKSTMANRGKMRGHVHVLPVGAGNSDEDTVIYLAPHNAGNNRIGAKEVAKKYSAISEKMAWQCQDVKVRRLDKLLPAGVHFDVAKFDVQGYELFAMQGLEGVLNRRSGGQGIDYIYYEVESEMLAENGVGNNDIGAFLSPLGYTSTTMERHGKDKLVQHNTVSSRVHINF
mmetsp:Transcript_61314/g.122880  ORF Transcript_61314/g.122880 Transcript_61314/m.122880 type:complete len:342 (-) Transcript_61314:286-1311(-)